MKALKLKMSEGEREGFCNMTRMFIAALECSPTEVGYINSIIMKNWFEKLEKKMPYLTGDRTISIGLELMTIYKVCSEAFCENLPPYEYTICLELIEAIHKAVEADKAIMRRFQQIG
jgi:uncharacterized protein YybS (DUF2232 family)